MARTIARTIAPICPIQTQTRTQRQGMPVRSNLRAGVVLQIEIPSVTAVQQLGQTVEAAVTVPATPTA